MGDRIIIPKSYRGGIEDEGDIFDIQIDESEAEIIKYTICIDGGPEIFCYQNRKFEVIKQEQERFLELRKVTELNVGDTVVLQIKRSIDNKHIIDYDFGYIEGIDSQEQHLVFHFYDRKPECFWRDALVPAVFKSIIRK